MSTHPVTDAGFATIVDDLYAGTLDEAAWGRAMVGIADMVRATGTLLLAVNPSNGAILREENHRVDPSVTDDYRRHWTYEDRRRAVPTGCPVTELTLGIPDWRRTPILNEFLLPVDLPHFMPAWLHKADTKMVALSLLGTRARGPFEPPDIENCR